MTDKDRYLIEELERRLCWYRDEATEEEFDAEEVDAICVMLQKLSPIKEPHMGKDEAYRNIMRRIQEEDGAEKADAPGEDGDTEKPDSPKRTDGREKKFEKGGGKKKRYFSERRGLRAAALFIAVFGAALLSLNMVTYAREDKSLFTMIMERVGFVKIVKDTSVEKDGIVNSGDEIKLFYDTWGELDSEIKKRIVVPKYIPNGCMLYGISYYEYINRKKILADYYDEKNGHLLIEITLWEDENREYRESAMDEEIYVLIPEYSDSNTLYYQYEDEYICMISMKNGFYRISGNIVLDEMLKVREGLSDIG